MSEDDGLICAYRFDGQGGACPLGWSDLDGGEVQPGTVWCHFNRYARDTQAWIGQRSGVGPVVAEALLAEDTRPRAHVVGDGLLVNLRGVNLNPGADPEDMISIRIWANASRIITVRGPKLMAVQDVRDRLERGRGPTGPGEFVTMLAGALLDRMSPVMEQLDDAIDHCEEEVVSGNIREIRGMLAGMRRQAIALRRYVAPQRDALWRVEGDPPTWLSAVHRERLREHADRVTRYVEDLDSARDRAAVTHEELAARVGEQMNRTMYMLSMVASVFLPLGLLTGLLGINVGGIPGADAPWAFPVVCIVLVVLAGFQVWLFRRLHWM